MEASYYVSRVPPASSHQVQPDAYDFSWNFYGRSNRLMAFGNQGIIVAEDGSKRVVHLVESESPSPPLYFSVEDEQHGRFPTGRRIAVDSVDKRRKSNEPIAGAAADDTSFQIEVDSFDGDRRFFPSTGSEENIYDQVIIRRSRLATPTPSNKSSFTYQREKSKTFRGNLVVILSAIYAVFLVTLGVVIGVADLIVPETNVGEIFSIYLLVLGLLWYTFLHFDLLRHNRQIRKSESYHRAMSLYGRSKYSKSSSGTASNSQTPRTLDYMFSRGRHCGGFFLKIGAAGFCFGHLIHSCMMLTRQIFHFISHDDIVHEKCAHKMTLALHLLTPIYSFYQLFILFKYSNVIINRLKELARFALMHSLASNLFFWFSMILRETVDSLHHRMIQDRHDSSIYSAPESGLPMLINLTGNASEYAALMGLWNGAVLNWDHCAGGSDFSALILRVSPYLYPFSIEYSILVGIWFIMWSNVGNMSEHIEYVGDLADSTSSRMDLRPPNLTNDLVMHADCHSANRGLFAGLLILVATVVSIIIFFLAFNNHDYVGVGVLVNLISECTLLILMIIVVALACRQLSQLDFNRNAVSLLDDLLLFMCIPCFFLYGIFSIVPAMAYSNHVAIIVIILQVVQVILQTPFIIDGLRRCSNSPGLQEKKPGRELITFLIVCNIAMWIIETFEIKSYETNHEQIKFYGYPLWTFLSHVTLPLTLFYRFHSSACLVDIWKSAYEMGQ